MYLKKNVSQTLTINSFSNYIWKIKIDAFHRVKLQSEIVYRIPCTFML